MGRDKHSVVHNGTEAQLIKNVRAQPPHALAPELVAALVAAVDLCVLPGVVPRKRVTESGWAHLRHSSRRMVSTPYMALVDIVAQEDVIDVRYMAHHVEDLQQIVVVPVNATEILTGSGTWRAFCSCDIISVACAQSSSMSLSHGSAKLLSPWMILSRSTVAGGVLIGSIGSLRPAPARIPKCESNRNGCARRTQTLLCKRCRYRHEFMNISRAARLLTRCCACFLCAPQ